MNPESEQIFKQVCETLKVKEDMVLSKTRLKPICEARFLAVYFIRSKNKRISFNTIGQWFGRSNDGSAHSFVIYGMKQVRILRETNTAFKLKFRDCINDLSLYDNNIIFKNIPQY